MNLLRRIKVQYLFGKEKYKRLQYALKEESYLPVVYYDIRNWGDQLNKYLIEELSQKTVLTLDIDSRYSQQKQSSITDESVYMVIGSILQHADKNTIVWGAGLINAKLPPMFSPKEIRAVRGELTAKTLRANGVECPDVFGDPALLLPRVYPDPNIKKFKLGIILHNDHVKHAIPQKLEQDKEVVLISLRKGIEFTLGQILACENIVSTSLHGLISADAYSIPNSRIIMAEGLYGGDFKFNDYYTTVDNQKQQPVLFNDLVTKSNLISICKKHDIKINLDHLYNACPFTRTTQVTI